MNAVFETSVLVASALVITTLTVVIGRGWIERLRLLKEFYSEEETDED